MKPRTARLRTQLPLNLEPAVPAAPRSAALVRILSDLLLEALDSKTGKVDAREVVGELEDHV